MQVKIAICDDNPQELKALQTEIVRVSELIKFEAMTYLYKDGNEVINLLCNKKEQFDILFLDIDMPDISGIDVARKIREEDLDIILVFVSAHEQYVFESIEYNPFRYIRKNRIEKELYQSIKAAVAFLKSQNEKIIVIKTDVGDVKVKPSEIMYYETENRKVLIHLRDGTDYFIWKTIKELMYEMSNESFIYIHSGCVANTKYISEFSSYDITLDNGKRLIASRRRRKDIKNALLRYWGDRV